MGGLEFWIGLGVWVASAIFAKKSLVWGPFRFLDIQEWKGYMAPILLLTLFWGVMYDSLHVSNRYEGTMLAAGILLSVVALIGMVESMRPQQSGERNNLMDNFFYGFRATWGLMGFAFGTLTMLGDGGFFRNLLVCAPFALLVMVLVFIPFSKLEAEFQGHEN